MDTEIAFPLPEEVSRRCLLAKFGQPAVVAFPLSVALQSSSGSVLVMDGETLAAQSLSLHFSPGALGRQRAGRISFLGGHRKGKVHDVEMALPPSLLARDECHF